MRVRRYTMLIAAAFTAGGARLHAQEAARGDAAHEAAYALLVARVADSAIHHLDFYPARAQLRAQMLFLAPRDSAAAVFYEIGKRSSAAAQVVDAITVQFDRTSVPDDLTRLHRDLMTSLRSARRALDRLAASANGCLADMTSVTRCQVPFTSASSAVDDSYSHYLATRASIAAQIVDTQTTLPDFSRRPAPF